jgi:hypothetical protein
MTIARAMIGIHFEKGPRMRSRHVPATILAVSMALTVAIVAGLPGTAAASSAPLVSADVLLLVPQDPTGTGLIVSGTLPSTAKLPGTVSLALPTGLQIQWAGEILGGDPSADPTAKYTTRRVGAWDVQDVTLTKVRIAQVEAAYPAGVTVAGGVDTAKLDWTAPEAIQSVSFTIRIPVGATVQSQSGGLVAGPASASETPYSITFSNVKAGQSLSASLVYKPAAAGTVATSTAPPAAAAPVNPVPQPGGTAQPVSSSPSPFIIFLVLLFLVSWTLYALMEVRKRQAAKAAKAEKAVTKPGASRASRAKASGSGNAKSKAATKKVAHDEDEDDEEDE